MKKLLTLLVTLASLSSHAQTVVVGGFGTDGASLESMPSANSVDLAAEIYQALNVRAESNGDKILETEDGAFSCERPSQGIHTLTAGCEFETLGGKVLSRNPMTVELASEISEKIYKALPAGDERRSGGSVRSVGNLSCQYSLYSRGATSYACTIIDVQAIAMNM